MYQHDFFHEFITDCPCGSTKLMDALEEKGILGGLPISENAVLWCDTEMNTEAEIDKLICCLCESNGKGVGHETDI